MRSYMCVIAILTAAFVSFGCEQSAGMPPEELQACKQFIADIEHSSSTTGKPALLSMPELSPGETILVTAPYAPTDMWLAQNTTLSKSGREIVIDMAGAIENIHVFVLNGSSVAFHAVLDQRFDVEPSQFLLHAGDQLEAVMIERAWRPIVLQRVDSTGTD